VESLAAWAPTKLISSSSIRCLQTIDPYAIRSKRKVVDTDNISQHRFTGPSQEITELIDRRLHKKKNAIICSHGPVIPVLLDEIIDATGTEPTFALTHSAELDTASFTVVHLRLHDPRSPIISVETHDSLV
jgi:8-oxo-dGTP diphosphatase